MNKNDEHLITRLEAVREKMDEAYEMEEWENWRLMFSNDEVQTLDAAIEALRMVATVIGADAEEQEDES